MALGWSGLKGNGSDSEDNKEGFGTGYDGFDPEKQGSVGGNEGPRKMSRIDRPITKSISGNIAGGRRSSDTAPMGADISVGKQVEMEEGNAIKYRTCSWPKV